MHENFLSLMFLSFFVFFRLTSYFMMDMDTRYNLRSHKRTARDIPVELQLASDADFLSHTVGSGHPMPGQVLSDQ